LTDIESIVIEIRQDGEVAERIKFLADADFRGEGIDIPLTDSNDVVPDGREMSLAITNLEQVMFWANAALARQP